MQTYSEKPTWVRPAFAGLTYPQLHPEHSAELSHFKEIK